MSETMSRNLLDLRDLTLHYRSAGDPEKPTLLMFHQTPSSSAMFETLARELAGDFHILAPDTPGFGDSEEGPGPVTMKYYAGVMRAFLDALEVERCDMFGHHSGAGLALQLAHDFPECARRLALSGPPLLDEAGRRALLQRAPQLAPREDGAHLLAAWRCIREKDPHAPLALSARETRLALTAEGAWQRAYRAVAEQPAAGQLAALRVPALVFAGDQDTLYPSLDAAHRLLKDGRKAVIEGAGTYACDRFAPQVAALLRKFFLGAAEGAAAGPARQKQ